MKRVAFITGASSGIGAAVARSLSRRGFAVALVARRRERLDELVVEFASQGRTAIAIEADVCKDGEMERAAATARAKLGPITLALANAGFGVVGSVEQLTLDDYRRQFETNIFGVLRTAKALLPDLRETKGCFGIVGSVMGFISLGGASPYGMSKFAVKALAESLYYEWGPLGVAVTHIAPGFVESEIRKVDNQGNYKGEAPDPMPSWIRMPTGKAGEKIAKALISRRREYIVTGHGKLLVFLDRHFSGLLRRIIRLFAVKGRPQPQT